MIEFKEVVPFSGVDTSKTPKGIIVPLGPGPTKFNMVRLTNGQGVSVVLRGGANIKVEKLGWLWGYFLRLPSPPSDRLFKISSILPSQNGYLEAMDPGGFTLDRLNVAVLKQKEVKLSIRPIQVLNPQGNLVYHSKAPFNFKDMVDQMNSVWTPQANVVFTLVSSNPVPLIDEARNAKLMNMAPNYTPPALKGPMNIEVFKDLLIENKDRSAQLTMFLVERVAQGPTGNVIYPSGATIDGVSLISDNRARLPLLMAHEAGHFLGQEGHTDDPDDANKRAKDPRQQLMVNGGADLGYKLIPFDLVVTRFNKQ